MKTYGSLKEHFGTIKNKNEYRFAQKMTIGMSCYNLLYLQRHTGIPRLWTQELDVIVIIIIIIITFILIQEKGFTESLLN